MSCDEGVKLLREAAKAGQENIEGRVFLAGYLLNFVISTANRAEISKEARELLKGTGESVDSQFKMRFLNQHFPG